MGNPTKGSMVVGGGGGGYLVRAVSGLDKCMVRKGSSAPASNGRLKPGRALQCTPMHQEQHNECIRGSNAPLIVPITAALHFQARQPPLSRTEGALIGERTFTGGAVLMHNVRRCNFSSILFIFVACCNQPIYAWMILDEAGRHIRWMKNKKQI